MAALPLCRHLLVLLVTGYARPDGAHVMMRATERVSALSQLTALRDISFKGTRLTGSKCLSAALRAHAPLRSLRMQGSCTSIGWAHFPLLPQLTEVHFQGCVGWTDAGPMLAVSLCPVSRDDTLRYYR